MEPGSKITLSYGEMQLVTDTDFILTKRIIIDKAQLLFGRLAEAMQHIAAVEGEGLEVEVLATSPKISKGENYLQLPYVLLDYPRCFDKTDVFAVRTMFWWGNFFSCTLHLSGKYKVKYLQALEKNIPLLQQSDLYVCTNTNEWEHHFESSNYVAANTLSAAAVKAILLQQHFIKVAAKFSLAQWNEMEMVLQKSFADLVRLLQY